MSAWQLCRRKVQHRDNVGFPSSPLPEFSHTTHSLPACLCHLSSRSLSAEAQGECLGVRESVRRPCKRMPGFPATLSPNHTDRILTDFHSQILWELLFRAWCGAVTPRSSRGTSIAELRLWILDRHTGASLFCISAPSTSLKVASLYP